jgi:hypothetical protein
MLSGMHFFSTLKASQAGPFAVSGALLAGCIALWSCKTQPVRSPEAIAAQDNCPSSDHVLADLKQIEDTALALNSMSTTPDLNDDTRCTVEVQLGKGSVVWASTALQYQRVVGRWRLLNNPPTFEQTLDGIRGTVVMLVEETCACTDQACLETVNARAARIVQPGRFKELVELDPGGMAALEARVIECTRRVASSDENSTRELVLKTEEAVVFVKKMADGAQVFYETPQGTGSPPHLTGLPPKTFPASVGPTPALGACCSQGGKCKGNMSQWDLHSWRALDFALRDPHYYSYEFEASLSETGKLSFSAIAHGDLDCDGQYSRFTIRGELDADGDLQLSELITDKPLE